jgi:pantothenate kinase
MPPFSLLGNIMARKGTPGQYDIHALAVNLLNALHEIKEQVHELLWFPDC